MTLPAAVAHGAVRMGLRAVNRDLDASEAQVVAHLKAMLVRTSRDGIRSKANRRKVLIGIAKAMGVRITSSADARDAACFDLQTAGGESLLCYTTFSLRPGVPKVIASSLLLTFSRHAMQRYVQRSGDTALAAFLWRLVRSPQMNWILAAAGTLDLSGCRRLVLPIEGGLLLGWASPEGGFVATTWIDPGSLSPAKRRARDRLLRDLPAPSPRAPVFATQARLDEGKRIGDLMQTVLADVAEDEEDARAA